MDLATALQEYAQTIAALEKRADVSTVLAVLRARDQAESARAATASPATDLLIQLITLDERLLDQTKLIHAAVDLASWQQSLNPPETAWWWFLAKPIDVRDRYDWLWSALNVTALTASASIVVDICGRFLTAGAPGVFGSFAVISQGVLTLATAGGVLTDSGRQLIEQMLDNSGIGRHWWQETKLGLSLALLAALTGFHAALPWLSEQTAMQGQTLAAEGNFRAAEAAYQRATNLDTSNAQAYHGLGQLYADWNRDNDAQEQLLLAVKEGYLPAFNSLATVYLENAESSDAVEILTAALNSIDDTPETQPVRAELLSSLGWARIQQERYVEAESVLKESITLQQDSSSQSIAATSAQPYCLLFQAAQQLAETSTAVQAAETCTSRANTLNAQEDRWAHEAREYLRGRAEGDTYTDDASPVE
ncbi:MAG: tetratricopeptide repeat protein [Cyanobacteria bacterium J06638_28]